MNRYISCKEIAITGEITLNALDLPDSHATDGVSSRTILCLACVDLLLTKSYVEWPTAPCPELLSPSSADSTRALKTRRLKRPTKRVATPTKTFNEEIYKNARSNLDERFWRLQFGVSPASSVSNAVGGVVNASACNVVQSTQAFHSAVPTRRWSFCAWCSIQKNLFAKSRRAHLYTMLSWRNIRTEKWRQHVSQYFRLLNQVIRRKK